MYYGDKGETDNQQGGKRKRKYLSAEKKYQIFLETQAKDCPVGEVLRREGMFSADLARIREQVKEGAMERLSHRPGKRKKTIPLEEHEILKKELTEKEKALAELMVELAIMRKKTNGGTWER